MRREASDAHATEDLDLAYEIVQPDGTTDNLSVPLRRSIGLDRNDRDPRLVQGSALDRLLSDKGLGSRMARELAKSDLKDDSVGTYAGARRPPKWRKEWHHKQRWANKIHLPFKAT
jgi:hypothetical protein